MASASAPKRLGVRLELHAERADGVDDARQRRVGCAHVRDRDARVEAERAVAVEERELVGRPRAFDGEHAELRRDAAARREAPRRAARREHAVARHDDREGVSPEGLPHRAGQALVAEARRHLAVRQGRARGNAAGDLVDAAVKRRHAFHVERHAVELARASCRGAPRWRRAPAARREAAAPRARPGTAAACERASPNHAPPGAGSRRRRARSTRCRTGRSPCRRA